MLDNSSLETFFEIIPATLSNSHLTQSFTNHKPEGVPEVSTAAIPRAAPRCEETTEGYNWALHIIYVTFSCPSNSFHCHWEWGALVAKGGIVFRPPTGVC
jgi:hypothetical protein